MNISVHKERGIIMNRIKPMNLFLGVQILTAGLVVFILYFANKLPLFEKYEGAVAVSYFNFLILAVYILHLMGSILYYLMILKKRPTK